MLGTSHLQVLADVQVQHEGNKECEWLMGKLLVYLIIYINIYSVSQWNLVRIEKVQGMKFYLCCRL